MEVKNKIQQINFEATTNIQLASGKMKTVTLRDYVYDTDDIELKYSLVSESIKKELDDIGTPLFDTMILLESYSLSDICTYRKVTTKYEETVEQDMPFIISSEINEDKKTEKVKGMYETNTYYSYYKLEPSEVSCSELVKDVLNEYMNLDNISIYTSCGISAYIETKVSRVFKDGRSEKISVALPLKDVFRGNIDRAVKTMLADLEEKLSDSFYRYKTEPYESICMSVFNSSDKEIIDNILLNSKYLFAKQVKDMMNNKYNNKYSEYLTKN